MNGFQLTGLRLLSTTGPSAELIFKPGMNVVSGPSDTGKSFAVECIDFMMGAKDPPRAIPEAARYETLQMSLRHSGAAEVTLQRPLRGGRMLVYDSPFTSVDQQTSTILAEQHSATTQSTISGFLLGVCNLWSKAILVKLSGKTRPVSFRNLVPFFLVKENSIIRVSSPIFKELNKEETVEFSVFRMLLTGLDDSSGRGAAIDPKVQKIRMSAEVDLIQLFISRVEKDLAALPQLSEGEGDRTTLEAMIREEARLVEEQRQAIAGIEIGRVVALRDAEHLAAELDEGRSLLTRFRILQEHYRSDLARLEAVEEVSARLEQLPVGECPWCGSPSQGRMPSPDGTGTGPTPEEFQAACSAERRKIQTHARGLTSAIEDLARNVDQLDLDARKITEKITLLGIASEEATKRLRQRSAHLAELAGRQAALERRAALEEQLAIFQASRSERVPLKFSAGNKQVHRLVGIADELKAFCSVVRTLLNAWHFPDQGVISFDPVTFDLSIGGRARSSFGKGLRAITHAAFTIALRLYCREHGIAHPGPVILDSPLVTYRKRNVKKGEELPQEIKDAFFEDLADRLRGEQVLIFDNEIPPKSVLHHTHQIPFGAPDGSHPDGFIPSGAGSNSAAVR